MEAKVRCFSCGGVYPDTCGPVHPYMDSLPGCWDVYGEVLRREYSNPVLMGIHCMSVDAYAVQHPGKTGRKSVQSVGVHLVRLCQFVELSRPTKRANAAMAAVVKNKHRLHWLEPPRNLGDITAADIYATANAESHAALVREWARSAWQAWSAHHPTIRSWLPNGFE